MVLAAEAAGLTVDWSLRLSDLIAALMFFAAGMTAFFGTKGRIEIVSNNLQNLEKTFSKETLEQNKKIDGLTELLSLAHKIGSIEMIMQERMNSIDQRFHDRMSVVQRQLDNTQRQLDDLKPKQGSRGAA
jgi:hypothetical protein